jgi:hypothetical protein
MSVLAVSHRRAAESHGGVMIRTVAVSVLVLSLWLGGAAVVAAGPAWDGPDAKLYELTENMSIGPDGDGIVSRLATAALQGTAKLGTPLCPAAVLITNPRAQTCTVTAIGSDSIDLSTGKGKVWGSYAVVVQGDNPVDGPEYVVQTGSFQGDIDLSPTAGGVPLGWITNGVFTIDGVEGQIPFSGTFRLPFSMAAKGKIERPRRGRDAFYLGDDGRPFPVWRNERSLDYPTVRFEVRFAN